MITKELVVAVLGLIMGIANTVVGHQIFSSDQLSQVAEIVFLIITFVAATLHKKPEEPPKTDIQIP